MCPALAVGDHVLHLVHHSANVQSAILPATLPHPASMCRGWLYFTGWGDGSEFGSSCTKHRVAEIQTAMDLVRSIQQHGASAQHVMTAGQKRKQGAAVLDALQGQLDLQSVALAGHSFGGATIAGVIPLNACWICSFNRHVVPKCACSVAGPLLVAVSRVAGSVHKQSTCPFKEGLFVTHCMTRR